MNGMFDIKLVDNRGKKDGYFEQAIQDGYIMDALDDLPTVRHLPKQQNWIFDNYAGCMMQTCLSGPAMPTHWTSIAVTTAAHSAMLSYIALTTAATLPTYTEDLTRGGSTNSIMSTVFLPDGVNTTSSAKRFIEDQITAPTIWADPTREAIYFRNRFLWLPSQGNSSSLTSIAIHATSDADEINVYYACRVGRVRLRDSAGLVTTLNKTTSNSLLVEYTFCLVSF